MSQAIAATGIRAIIFDYGGVLTLAPRECDRERLRELAGGTDPDFWPRYWQYRAAYDLGELDSVGYWREVVPGADFTRQTLARLVAADIAMWNLPNGPMLRWAAGLAAAGIKLGVLSNMHRDHAATLRADRAYLARFDCLVISSELGIVKPAPAIYRYCLRELGAVPGETLLIDDREANVAGARAVGIGGLRFDSNRQLARELAAGKWIAPELVAPLEDE